MEEQANTKDAGSALQRAALFGVATSVAAVAGGVIRAKATALSLGPEGFGTSAAVLQITGLFFVPLTLVTGPALISSLAKARADAGSGQRYHDTAATLVVVGGMVLAGFSTLASLVVFRNQGPELVLFTSLASVGALVEPLVRVPTASLLARGDMRRYAIVTATASGVVAVIAGTATVLAGLWGQFLASALLPCVLLLAFTPLWRSALPGLRLFPRPAFDREFLAVAAAVGFATLLSGAASQGALSVIRWALWQRGGAESNGQFQAAWAVGSAYLGIVLQGIGTGVFPRYASATKESLPAEVDAAARFVLDAAPPVILLAIAVRAPAMHLLYSSEFDVAADMVGYQMAADLAKALSFVYGGVLLYRGEVRAYLVTEFVGATLLALLPALLVPRFGELGVSYGYAGTYVIYVVLTAVVLARTCDVPVRPRVLGHVLLFTVLTVALVRACVHWPLLDLPVAAVGLVWASQTGLSSIVLKRVRHRLGWTKT